MIISFFNHYYHWIHINSCLSQQFLLSICFSFSEYKWSITLIVAMLLVPLLPLVATMGSGLHWPIQRFTNYTGDIIIGALFPIHERDQRWECGRLQVCHQIIYELYFSLIIIEKYSF